MELSDIRKLVIKEATNSHPDIEFDHGDVNKLNTPEDIGMELSDVVVMISGLETSLGIDIELAFSEDWLITTFKQISKDIKGIMESQL